MASVWKRDRSPFYYACYSTSDGRQLKKSTGLTDEKSAMKVAVALEEAEEMAGRGTATEARLRALLSQTIERVTAGEESLRSPTVRAFLKEWIDSKGISEASRERYQNTLDLFIEHIGRQADKPLTAVTAGMVQSWVTERSKKDGNKNGIAPKTLSVDVKTLSAAFNRAKRHNLIPYNPVEGVELPKIVTSERKTFSPSEVKLVFDAAPNDWRTVILLGLYTGARLGDCAGMKWDAVNLTDGTVTFTAGKTGQKVVVPTHAELAAHLDGLASQDKAQTYIAPSLAGRKTGGEHGLSKRFKRIMEDAGIDAGMVQGQGKRQFSKLSFHSFRHTFNSWLANSGVSQELRMKLTGHASEAMNTGYTHHEMQTLKTAIDLLPSLSGTKEKARK